jgi:hypothetical protein
VKLLTRFNIYIDGVLERRQNENKGDPIYMMIETELDRKYIEAEMQ